MPYWDEENEFLILDLGLQILDYFIEIRDPQYLIFNLLVLLLGSIIEIHV
jgi:hypothetical protein